MKKTIVFAITMLLFWLAVFDVLATEYYETPSASYVLQSYNRGTGYWYKPDVDVNLTSVTRSSIEVGDRFVIYNNGTTNYWNSNSWSSNVQQVGIILNASTTYAFMIYPTGCGTRNNAHDTGLSGSYPISTNLGNITMAVISTAACGEPSIDINSDGYSLMGWNVTEIGGGSPPASPSGLRNVTFTAKSNYDATSYSTFNITVNGGGTNGTTSGSLIIELNITSLFNITFHHPTLYIVNDTYTDANLSTDLQGWLHQAELYITAEDYFTSDTINTFNTTVGTNKNSTTTGTTTHHLNASNYTITGNSSNYYASVSETKEAIALSNQTETIQFYKLLNLTAVSIQGSPINNFSANIRGLTYGSDRTNSTTTGYIEYYVTNETYNITINATGYAKTFNSELIQINQSSAYTELEITLYTTNSFDIQFIDEATSQIINGTQIFLDLISDLYANNYSTTNGTLYIDLLTPTTYTFRYYGTGYQPRLSTYTLVNDTYNQITLYLLTGGDNVSIYIYDTSRYPVENSTINIHRYSTVNNSYLLVNTINTDFEGKAVTNLQLSSEFYRFYIYYGGVLKLSTSPAYITGTELIFTITLDDDILDTYFKSINDYTYTLTFNPSSKNFRFYYDTNNEASQGCLKIYKVSTSGGETLHNSSCLSAASGTILLAGQNVSGTSYLAKGIVTVDSTQYVLKTLNWRWLYQTFTQSNKELGIFIVIVLTLIFAFIGMWSLPVAFLLTPLPLVFGSIQGFINIPVGTAIGIEIICLILAGLISRN